MWNGLEQRPASDPSCLGGVVGGGGCAWCGKRSAESLLTLISCTEKQDQKESRNLELLAGLSVAWMLQRWQVPSRGLSGVGHLSGDDRTHDKPRTKQEDEEMLGAAPLRTARRFLPLAAPSLLLRTESCCRSERGQEGSSCETRQVRTNPRAGNTHRAGQHPRARQPRALRCPPSGWDRTGWRRDELTDKAPFSNQSTPSYTFDIFFYTPQKQIPPGTGPP